MSNEIRWQQRLDNYERALAQLNAAIELSRQRPLSNLEKQGMVQGFEMAHELAWNLLKDYLRYEGIMDIVGSRSAVREAFRLGLIADGALWMDMISKRNLSSHTYNQALADSLVDAIIHDYHAAFMTLAADMRAKAGDDHVRPA